MADKVPGVPVQIVDKSSGRFRGRKVMRFRRVPEQMADWLMRFRSVPVQMANEVPRVAVQIVDKVPAGSGAER